VWKRALRGSGMDAVDRHKEIRGPSVGIVSNLVQYRVSFSTALFSHLQLSYLHWLVSVQSVSDLYLQVSHALHFLSHGDAALVLETH
jgi:hypothetical protein